MTVIPKKHLSQNFLTDPNIARKIVRTAAILPHETILEIGPGLGALTIPLLETGAHIIAVEKDPELAARLSPLQTPDSRLSIYPADILQFPIPDHAKIVANLPYHITTPILEKILSRPFTSCTLMIQKEVATRLLASPGTKNFSSLTLFLQFYARITHHFPVSSSCFSPRPKVDSTVIHIVPNAPPLANPEPFFQLIRRAFQQRRKMMSTSLGAPQEIREALAASGLRTDARPEMLSLTDWLNVYDALAQRSASRDLVRAAF